MPARKQIASPHAFLGTYEERARVFKALADPHRLRILDLLSEEGSLAGSDLAERMGISVALLSHHWKILTDAGLISREQRGQTKYCRLECARIEQALEPWPVPPSDAAQARKAAKAAAAKSAAKSSR